MATKNTRKSTKSARTYGAPTKEALGLNQVLPNGNVLAHLFGAKDANAKAVVSVIFQKDTNVAYVNIRSKDKTVKPFSARVDACARPQGMTMARFAYVASLTGHVFLRK